MSDIQLSKCCLPLQHFTSDIDLTIVCLGVNI
jgi:hypothetical protein